MTGGDAGGLDWPSARGRTGPGPAARDPASAGSLAPADFLRGRARTLRERAAGLDALAGALPGTMDAEAEAALQRMLRGSAF